MPSAGLEPATPALGRRRSGPLSYEGMLPAGRQREVISDIRRAGRSSARLERSVRDREAESSNLFAPTTISSPKALDIARGIMHTQHTYCVWVVERLSLKYGVLGLLKEQP